MPATGALSLTDRDGAVSIGPLGPGRYRAAVVGEADRPHEAQHKATSGADSIEVELPATTEVVIDLAQER